SGGVGGKATDVAADRLPAHPRAIERAGHGADRGARNCNGPDAQLVERLEHRDMRESARAAGTERKRQAFHQAPAPANDHATVASGRTMSALAAACSLVAVPSRTRPAMPCRIAAIRKKL